MKIYKYPIPVNDNIELELPMNSKILTIQMQKSKPFIWALVNPGKTIGQVRHLELYGTGMDVPEGREYIGSFQMLGGDLVFHLFEKK